MKLAISNIAWDAQQDREMYEYLAEKGIQGLEIAPTRIFPLNPYAHLKEAQMFARELKTEYGLEIPSIQSIWYGKTENVFGTKAERQQLLEYTKKAIQFAQAVGSTNLVFGCPKNRNQQFPENVKENKEIAEEFFTKVSEYAASQGTVLAIEANPPSYHTNFWNQTEDVLSFVQAINKTGLRINLDTGTMLQNQENAHILRNQVNWIHHVHISEPNLNKIEARQLHEEILTLLQQEYYTDFVSIEMKRQDSIQQVKETIDYLRSIVNRNNRMGNE